MFCPSCEATFEAAPPTGETRIRVSRNGQSFDAQAVLLNRRIDRLGGAAGHARQPDGRLKARAVVEAQFVSNEDPLRFRDRLLGFIERLDERVPGTLLLDGNEMELIPEPAGSNKAAGQGAHRWTIDEIDSLQTSSSSVQISLGARGVVLFRFPDDSVRRWDDLIRRAIRERWRALGRGDIVEFQPRVRAE
ncbi:MAG: hypothetical protein EA351_10860 [Gemmatimonadales bacterium]|nr:MAG: hypothetical protein EA351_10860 [Gemmatimonadales bacterium]